MPRPKRATKKVAEAAACLPKEADLPARPEIGAPAHFKKAKPPTTDRFDSSLAPELQWDDQYPAREQAEAALREIAEGVPGFRFQVSGKPPSPEDLQRLAKELQTRNHEVELLGLDTFHPVMMEADHLKAAVVPAWLLDTDDDGVVFRARQAFFPRTGAWENLKQASRGEFEDTVWDHRAGTTSAPSPSGEHGQIAVKVIDPRGNELLAVKKLEAAP